MPRENPTSNDLCNAVPTPTASLDALRLRLAAQLAPQRRRSPLRVLASRVQAGEPLELCIRQVRMPADLRGLLLESLAYREPTSFVLNAMRANSQLKNSWGQFSSVIAYPLILLILAVFGGAFFSFQLRGIVVWELIDDSMVVAAIAADQHNAVVGAALVLGWSAIMFLLLKTIGPSWAWTAVVGSLMLVGRPTRWLRLQEILLRFQAVAEQGVPDGHLATSVARSFLNSGQEMVTMQIARRVEAGMQIGQALASTNLSDGLCSPALALLDQRDGAFSEKCATCAELMGRLVRQRCSLLSVLVPVLVIVLVGSLLWSIVSAYLHILITMLVLLNVWW